MTLALGTWSRVLVLEPELQHCMLPNLHMQHLQPHGEAADEPAEPPLPPPEGERFDRPSLHPVCGGQVA